MKTITLQLIVLIFVFSYHHTIAQKVIKASDVAEPDWIHQNFPPKSNNSYYYKVVFGEGNTLTKAKEGATKELLITLSKEHGVNVNSTSEFKTSSKITGGTREFAESFQNSTVLEGEGFKTAFKETDNYWQLLSSNGSNIYRYWVLFAVSDDINNHSFDEINIGKYGIAPVWRSALVPGWGQLYKKEKRKGTYILASEGVLLSGTLISAYFKNLYSDKALQTKDITARRDYLNYSDNFETSRNVFGVLAIGVYIYNLVDVMTSRGAKKYNYSNASRIKIKANYDNDFYFISMNYNF